MRRPLSTLLGLLLWIAACAPAPPWVQAYKALDATATSVDVGMRVAGDLYRAGKIDDREKGQILAAYSTYQQAARTAYGAVKAWNDAKAGQPSDRVMADVRIAADGLLALIESLKARK